MRVVNVEVSFNRAETELLAAILSRAVTKPEQRFASELLDRIPLDLHPKEGQYREPR